MIDMLQGTWHLIYSNFDKWKKDGIHQVTFNYTPIIKDGKAALRDEVKFMDGAKEKSVRGYDIAEDDTRFTWHGSGLLYLLTSKWQIEWMHADKTCMVISFEKTLLTAAGVDIIARDKKPRATYLSEAKALIKTNDRLQQLSNGLAAVA